VAFAVAVAACSPQTPTAAEVRAGAQAGLMTEPLTIHSANGAHRFTVEIARTPDQQEIGLMFRRSLPPDRGMIFPYDPPFPASFWMKNTLIPLDMIFIAADGTVKHVHANAVPLSTDAVPSRFPVRAVLEINGGSAALLGIKPGDKVRHPIFGNA